jgi:hypothetical protein
MGGFIDSCAATIRLPEMMTESASNILITTLTPSNGVVDDGTFNLRNIVVRGFDSGNRVDVAATRFG